MSALSDRWTTLLNPNGRRGDQQRKTNFHACVSMAVKRCSNGKADEAKMIDALVKAAETHDLLGILDGVEGIRKTFNQHKVEMLATPAPAALPPSVVAQQQKAARSTWDRAAAAPPVADARVQPTPVAQIKHDLVYFDQANTVAPKRPILKNVIARNETSSWFGSPGASKSALLTEIAICCAATQDWRGHRAKEGCGCIYFALERGDLTVRRLAAYRQRDGLSGLPIAVRRGMLDLLSPAAPDLIVAVVNEAEKAFGIGCGLLVVDSYSKALSTGDENQAKDQNRAAANLRRVHEALGGNVHIALIGHSGKDEARGARGSNAHQADVDLQVQITDNGDGIKAAEVIKNNDGPEGPLASYRLEVLQTGNDEDGDPATIALVARDLIEDFEPRGGTGRATRSQQRLTPSQRRFVEVLAEALLDAGELVPGSTFIPPGIKAVTREQLKKHLIAQGFLDGDKPHSARTIFNRMLNDLAGRHLIGTTQEHVWLPS